MTGELVIVPPDLSWVNQYIGIPFEEANCWVLTKRILEVEFGLEIPSYGPLEYGGKAHLKDISDRMDAAAKARPWVEVPLEEASCGDVIKLRMKQQLKFHVGLVFAPGWMIHTEEGALSSAEEYTTWEWKHVGKRVYRHEELIRRAA